MQKPEILRFAPVIFFNFYFALLIGIIDNIITYSLYSPHYVTKTSANGSAVYWSRDTHYYYPHNFIRKKNVNNCKSICCQAVLYLRNINIHYLEIAENKY